MKPEKVTRLKQGAKTYNEEEDKFKPGIYKTNNEVLFRIIDNHLMTGIIILEDNSEDIIKPGIYRTKMPKIPLSVMKQVINFFRFVYGEHRNSEAIILLWYNPDSKLWEIEVPEQRVSGASAKYDRDDDYTDEMFLKGYKLVGTIHSHGEMGAFHSGTDDADEYGFDGLHITIGKVNSGPEFAARYIMKEWAKTMKPEEVLEFEDESIPEEWKKKVNKRVGITTASHVLFDDNDEEKFVNPYKKNYGDWDVML